MNTWMVMVYYSTYTHNETEYLLFNIFSAPERNSASLTGEENLL